MVGKPLAVVYTLSIYCISICTGCSPSRHIQDNYQFPKILWVHFQQLHNGQVSQHFQRSRMSNSDLPRPNAHS